MPAWRLVYLPLKTTTARASRAIREKASVQNQGESVTPDCGFSEGITTEGTESTEGSDPRMRSNELYAIDRFPADRLFNYGFNYFIASCLRFLCAFCGDILQRFGKSAPPYWAASPSCSSMRRSWLYLAMRSLREALPVLIWPVLRATARSAIVASSVSPLRWLMTLV